MNLYFADVSVKTKSCVNKVVVLYTVVDPFTYETTGYIKNVDKEGLEDLIAKDCLSELLLGGLWYKNYHTAELASMQAFVRDWDNIVKEGE